MSSFSYRVSEVASRYAAALIDLAEQNKLLKKVESDITDLRAMLAGSEDLVAFVRSPLIGQSKQAKAIQEIGKKAKLQDLTMNFLGVIAQNRRLAALPEIVDAFFGEMNKRLGKVTVHVKTAQDMSAAQMKNLQAALNKATGTEVVVDAQVEPAIMGGMIITVGSYMIDDSVARKLERLKTRMNQSSNENTVTNVEEVA